MGAVVVVVLVVVIDAVGAELAFEDEAEGSCKPGSLDAAEGVWGWRKRSQNRHHHRH